MDILISSNFERLLWFLAFEVYGSDEPEPQGRKEIASSKVRQWQADLKAKGGFAVDQAILDAARKDFTSERVSDDETIATIQNVYQWPVGTTSSKPYVIDPHSAIGVTAALRSKKAAPEAYHVTLATAHPAKFSSAVDLALSKKEKFQFKNILPDAFIGIEELPRRVTHLKKSDGIEGIRSVIINKIEQELGRKLK